MIFALPSDNGHDYAMRIFNSDGSEPEMCGNGIRCLAKFMADRNVSSTGMLHKVHTLAGKACLPMQEFHRLSSALFLLSCEPPAAGLMQPELLEDGQVCVDMGSPILEAEAVPTTLPPTQVGCQIVSFWDLNSGFPTWSMLKCSTISETRKCKSQSVLQDGAAVKAPLQVDGTTWLMTCVSMGNPHAVTFGTADGQGIKVPCSTCLCL